MMRCKGLMRGVASGLVLLALATVAAAAVKLPAVIGDNMVLQRGQSVPIWGWADKGEQITVAIAGQSVTAKADATGRWQVNLAKLEAGGPHDMTIHAASGDLALKNILVGEVWVCSGQSNMEMGIGGAKDSKQEIAAAKYPQIRLFTVAKIPAKEPAVDVKGAWAECSPVSVSTGGWGGFSAAAYYFGRALHQELEVPVGLIHTSWGGTPAQRWTSRKALEAVPALKGVRGSDLYNGMIAPLIPYAIRGAIWYQGEANVGGAYQYRTLFPTMIRNWRTDWAEGDFPFYFVEIAPYNYTRPGKDGKPIDESRRQACAELWEAQLLTLKNVPNTGMAVTTDIGDVRNIHPQNKQEVGRRLALWALAKVYAHDVVCSGPIYQSMAVEGNKIRLTFDSAAGLKAADGKPLSYFTIAGADQKFVPAEAQVDGSTILVSSAEVAQPAAVRFGWREDAQPNLVNGAGLPASPFRTDTWKGVTQP
jgi:sialate O-acetylesterase